LRSETGKDENCRAPDALKPIDTGEIVAYNKIQIFDKNLTGQDEE